MDVTARECRLDGFPPLWERGRRRALVVIVALGLGQAVAAGCGVFAMREAFAALGAAALPVGALVALLVVGITIAAMRVKERTVAESLGQEYATALRGILFALEPIDYSAKGRAASSRPHVAGDLTAVRAWISLGLARAVSAAIVFPGVVMSLMVLNAQLATAIAVPLIVSVVAMAIYGPRLRLMHRRLSVRRAQLAAGMSGRIPVARVRRDSHDLCEAAVDRARATATLRAFSDTGAALAGVSLLLAALLNGTAPADVAGALVALAILVQPLRDLAIVWDRRRAWEVARDKLQGALHTPIEPEAGVAPDAAVAVPATPGPGPAAELESEALSDELCVTPQRWEPARLDFELVSAPTLRYLSVTALPGQIVSVVGSNGSGKSGLLALAAGLEDATEGEVLIDGTEIGSLPLAQRLSDIVYVGPRCPTLKGSLRRALTLGVTPRPDDAALKAVIREFGLDAVVARLGGLDSQVSKGGLNLSVGAGLRLQLARARLFEPRLLLLDVAVGTPFADGRELIQTVVEKLRATTLIATNDIALARGSDVIWHLERGWLKASGPAARLLDGNGPTARFFRPSCVA